MATFVKVTDLKGRKLILNLDQVQYFREREEGGCTVIFEKGDTFGLMESGSQVTKIDSTKWKKS